jgi:hypothetical protein
MQKLRNYIFGAVIVALVGAAMVACEASDAFAPKQRVQIESFLAQNSLEYRLTSDSVYVHTAYNSLPEGDQTVIQSGDRVKYNFEAYTFNGRPATLPYYTNKEWLAEQLGDVIDTSFWDFEPVSVRLGGEPILKGLESALPSCRKGDSVVVFLTSSNAYGDRHVGVVPANTAVMMVLNILDVEN